MTLSKPDFDFSKVVDVPNAWIENALNIPNTPHKTPKVIPLRRYIAAASIVLVAALSVRIYFLFGNKNPISVSENEYDAMTEAASDEPAFTAAPTDAAVADSTGNAAKDPPASTAPTLLSAQLSTDNRGIITAPTHSSEAPVDASSAVPPTSAANTAPASPPDELRSSPTHPAPKPTDHPEVPTAAPVTEKPTQAYAPDIKTLRLSLRAEAPTVAEANEDDAALFCCVYDSNGNPLGDSDLFSSGHRVDISSSYQSDGVVYNYSVEYDANQVPDNRFTYKVYLKNGTVLQEGTVEG